LYEQEQANQQAREVMQDQQYEEDDKKEMNDAI
jgi:hypothetical protein